jgi:hypothetical protein
MKTLFTGLLIAVGILICSCKGKNENAAMNTDVNNEKNVNTTAGTGNSNSLDGTYDASGTISFTAGGVGYSCSVSKVIAASTSLTIQTSTADVRTSGSVTIVCYTAASAITTGTYSVPSSTTFSSVTFVDKTVTPFIATTATSGSSCSVTITALTPTSVQGTFTATVLKPLDKSSLSITDGAFNCTIAAN